MNFYSDVLVLVIGAVLKREQDRSQRSMFFHFSWSMLPLTDPSHARLTHFRLYMTRCRTEQYTVYSSQ